MIPALLVSLVRAVFKRLRGRSARSLARLALVFAPPGALLAALLFVLSRDAPAPASSTVAAPALAAATASSHGPSSPPSAIEPMSQLQRALDEAQRNCDVARALARGALPPPGTALFRTVELETALLENPWVVDRALGEVDTLLRECAWLDGLEPTSTLGRRTWEDVRFLLGGVHWYLERAWDAGARSEVALRASRSLAGPMLDVLLPEPRRHELVDDHDRAAMRAYRDVSTFEDLLGEWD